MRKSHLHEHTISVLVRIRRIGSVNEKPNSLHKPAAYSTSYQLPVGCQTYHLCERAVPREHAQKIESQSCVTASIVEEISPVTRCWLMGTLRECHLSAALDVRSSILAFLMGQRGTLSKSHNANVMCESKIHDTRENGDFDLARAK